MRKETEVNRYLAAVEAKRAPQVSASATCSLRVLSLYSNPICIIDTDYCVNPNAMRESTTEAVISTDVPSTNATTVEPEITTVAPDTTTAESETTAEEPEITVAESETTSIETDSLNLETSIPSLSPADIPAPAPKVVAVSATFCTPTDPCPMCYGDCDVSYH